MNDEIVISQQAQVSCDFEAIKAHLDGQLEAYRNMVFTEETKKDAKNTVAELRKEKKLFTDRVKEVKKEYMKPYDEFYEKACELSDMYDRPINFINEQIEAFESKRIAEKKEAIKAIYEEMVPEPDMQEVISLAAIYSTKWENATCTEKQIREDIMNRKLQAKDAINLIKNRNSDKEAEAIDIYKRALDLVAALTYIESYEANKREIMAREQERLQRENEERIRAEERAKIEAEQRLIQAQEEARKEVIDNLIPEELDGAPEAVYTYDITLTALQKESLEIYMNSVGISYELQDLPM